MADSEQGFKWWLRYIIVPLIGGGGLIAIVVAIISRPSPPPLPLPSPPPNWCKFDDLLKSSMAVPVFVTGQSLATIDYPVPNNLSVKFQNHANGSGVAFRLTPMLNMEGCKFLELRGTSTKAFTFLVEYKIYQTNGPVIAQISKQQLFPVAPLTYTVTIPLTHGSTISGAIAEIVFNFFKIGESSQLTVESIQLK